MCPRGPGLQGVLEIDVAGEDVLVVRRVAVELRKRQEPGEAPLGGGAARIRWIQLYRITDPNARSDPE